MEGVFLSSASNRFGYSGPRILLFQPVQCLSGSSDATKYCKQWNGQKDKRQGRSKAYKR
jgi:hypothetical protein